jgi:general secretion pathway protein M
MTLPFLQRFTPREQVLLGGLGASLILLLLVFGIIMPTLRFQDRATADFASAQRIAALGEAMQPQQAVRGSGRNIRSAVTNAANQRGVTLTRINAANENEIEVALENVPYTAFWSWLRGLEETEGIVVAEAYVTPGETGGRIEARLTLRKASR